MNESLYKKLLLIVFLISGLYWGYLILNAQMLIRYDAIGYENLGQMLRQEGWLQYFKTGPNREPLYPLLISFSMGVGEAVSLPYTYVQKFLQVGVLLITQILMLILLGQLNVNRWIKLLTVLYVGFSPGLVNSALSLFSEIVAYPFVLALILLNVAAWKMIRQEGGAKIAGISLAVGLMFTIVSFGKGIFQYIYLAFMIPYVLLGVGALLNGKKRVCLNAVLFVVISFALVQSSVFMFKNANRKMNGNFVFTNRVSGLLFGNTLKRTEEMSSRLFWAHIASIPGGGVCRKFFSEEECRYCEFHQADASRAMINEIIAGVPQEQQDAKIISASFKKITQNPIQYAALMGIESLRMPFWESSQIGFVGYPAWLQKIFHNGLFKNGIRLLVSLLTIFALGFVLIKIIKEGKSFFAMATMPADTTLICFFSLLMIGAYTFLYSLFSIITRYSLVIAPVYLLLIAYSLHIILSNKLRKTHP